MIPQSHYLFIRLPFYGCAFTTSHRENTHDVASFPFSMYWDRHVIAGNVSSPSGEVHLFYVTPVA